MRQLVYVCAPYRAETQEGILWNVARANALGALAVCRGFAPVIPHAHEAAYILAATAGGDANELALAGGLAQLKAVWLAGGHLWVLRRDDGTLSAGCQMEITHWTWDGEPLPHTEMSWEAWGGHLVSEGLRAEWERLRRGV